MTKPETAPTPETARRMIADMARLQEAHNVEVAADWRTRGLRYERAIWVECAELLDHFGWKWWKKQTPDMDQVELELVDIWHFGLSMLIRDGGLDEHLAAVLSNDLPPARRELEADAEVFRDHVERLAATALVDARFDVEAFVACLAWLGVDLASLYATYVGKNVLNGFRQRNGYKDGSYRKVWDGREDNEHLVDLVAELDVTAPTFADALAAALDARYQGSS